MNYKKLITNSLISFMLSFAISSYVFASETFEEYLEQNEKYYTKYKDANPTKQEKMRARWHRRKKNDARNREKRKEYLEAKKEKRLAKISAKREKWASLSEKEKRARIRAKHRKDSNSY